jgi:hypothetical protein
MLGVQVLDLRSPIDHDWCRCVRLCVLEVLKRGLILVLHFLKLVLLLSDRFLKSINCLLLVNDHRLKVFVIIFQFLDSFLELLNPITVLVGHLADRLLLQLVNFTVLLIDDALEIVNLLTVKLMFIPEDSLEVGGHVLLFDIVGINLRLQLSMVIPEKVQLDVGIRMVRFVLQLSLQVIVLSIFPVKLVLLLLDRLLGLVKLVHDLGLHLISLLLVALSDVRALLQLLAVVVMGVLHLLICIQFMTDDFLLVVLLQTVDLIEKLVYSGLIRLEARISVVHRCRRVMISVNRLILDHALLVLHLLQLLFLELEQFEETLVLGLKVVGLPLNLLFEFTSELLVVGVDPELVWHAFDSVLDFSIEVVLESDELVKSEGAILETVLDVQHHLVVVALSDHERRVL